MTTEMTISEYDLMVYRDQQAEKKRQDEAEEREAERRHDRAIERWKNGSLAVGILAAAATVCFIVFIIWQGAKGPSASEELETQEKIECTEQQGTWLYVSGSDSSNASAVGTCIFSPSNTQD